MSHLENCDCWARCKNCGEVLWCQKSEHDQSCGCRCGRVVMVNGRITVSRGVDRNFTEAEIEAEMVKEYDAR